MLLEETIFSYSTPYSGTYLGSRLLLDSSAWEEFRGGGRCRGGRRQWCCGRIRRRFVNIVCRGGIRIATGPEKTGQGERNFIPMLVEHEEILPKNEFFTRFNIYK